MTEEEQEEWKALQEAARSYLTNSKKVIWIKVLYKNEILYCLCLHLAPVSLGGKAPLGDISLSILLFKRLHYFFFFFYRASATFALISLIHSSLKQMTGRAMLRVTSAICAILDSKLLK